MSQPFIRKSLLTITASFPGGTQPSAASASVTYTQWGTGATNTDTVTLSYNSSAGTWTGTWDSSRAAAGAVSWVVYSTGAVQAAQQGQFVLQANAANAATQ